MWDLIISVISGIVIPIVLYIANRIYYLNHKITNIETEVKELKKDVSWIKKLLEEVREKVFK